MPLFHSRLVVPTLVAVVAVTACGEDDPPATPGPEVTGPTSTTTTTSSAGGATTTSTSSNGGSPGAGGAGATGGAAATGGAGGTGGAMNTCPPIVIGDGVSAECSTLGTNSLPDAGTTECPADIGVYWPAQIYAVTVQTGDCLHMAADNSGPSAPGADLFGAIVDPSGSSLLFDDEMPCTVTNPDGFACPDGAVTIETSGTAYVMVGAYEGNGCPVGDTSPYALSVALNGTDVDLSAGPVCAGDLQTIIP